MVTSLQRERRSNTPRAKRRCRRISDCRMLYTCCRPPASPPPYNCQPLCQYTPRQKPWRAHLRNETQCALPCGIWLCEMLPLDIGVQERGEVFQQCVVFGVEETLVIVVAGDKRGERDALEFGFDGLRFADVRDADGRCGEMAEVVQGGSGELDLTERELRLLLGLVALPYEIVAVVQTAEHGDVAPLEQAEREDFFHWQVA